MPLVAQASAPSCPAIFRPHDQQILVALARLQLQITRAAEAGGSAAGDQLFQEYSQKYEAAQAMGLDVARVDEIADHLLRGKSESEILRERVEQAKAYEADLTPLWKESKHLEIDIGEATGHVLRDGRFVYAAAEGSEVRYWDPSGSSPAGPMTAAQIKQFKKSLGKKDRKKSIMRIVVSPSETLALIEESNPSGRQTKIVKFPSMEVLREVEARRAVFSLDGNTIAYADHKNVYVEIATTGKSLAKIKIKFRDGTPLALALSPDGKYVAAGTRLDDKPVRVWEVATGQLVADYDITFFEAFAFDPTHPKRLAIAAGLSEPFVRIYELGQSVPVVAFNEHKTLISTLDYSSDGRFLIGGSGTSSTIQIWDLKLGAISSVLKSDANVDFVRVTPDASRIYSFSKELMNRSARVTVYERGNAVAP